VVKRGDFETFWPSHWLSRWLSRWPGGLSVIMNKLLLLIDLLKW
jgi:hypothetical protein